MKNDLVESDYRIISEIELLDLIEETRKEYKNGKLITAASIADLI